MEEVVDDDAPEHLNDMDDDCETSQDGNMDPLSEIKNSFFNLVFKIEDGFVEDQENYEKAIKAFSKQEKKIIYQWRNSKSLAYIC